MRGQVRVVSGPAPWATWLLAVHNKVLKAAGPSSAARRSARGRRGSEELDLGDEGDLDLDLVFGFLNSLLQKTLPTSTLDKVTFTVDVLMPEGRGGVLEPIPAVIGRKAGYLSRVYFLSPLHMASSQDRALRP
ncbi:hypothetical protein MHYP_G00329260 [Metynnis hypsauchen]